MRILVRPRAPAQGRRGVGGRARPLPGSSATKRAASAPRRAVSSASGQRFGEAAAERGRVGGPARECRRASPWPRLRGSSPCAAPPRPDARRPTPRSGSGPRGRRGCRRRRRARRRGRPRPARRSSRGGRRPGRPRAESRTADRGELLRSSRRPRDSTRRATSSKRSGRRGAMTRSGRGERPCQASRTSDSSPSPVEPATNTGRPAAAAESRSASAKVGGGGEVVLQVAEAPDSLRRRAESLEAARILLRLHRGHGEPGERLREEPPDEAVTREGTLGDPAIDERHRDPAALGALEEERPDLRLGQNDQARARLGQGLLDRSREVEREGVDRGLAAERTLGELAARRRRDGDAESGARHASPKLREQVARHADLADRDRVDPDASGEIRPLGEAEPAPDVAEPAPARERAQEGIGGVGG